MAANSINLTNRLTGLYSGLDTDALVNTMMQIEQLKLNRQLRSLTTMQWKQEAYNSVNTDLKTFVNDYISILGSNSMMKSSSYVAYDAEILGDRASSVKISGSANACEGTIRINSITQLAEASAATSAGKVSKNGELSELNSASLQSLDFATRLDFVDKKISFAINDVEFTFSSADSLQTMLNTVNSSGAGVTMSYSRITDAFSIESKEQGADGAVNIRNISGNAFGAGSAFGIDNGSYKNGRNALLNINGVDLEKSSNKFDIDGVNYTLISTFEEDEGPVTAVLTRNVGNAVDSVKQFVEGYNTLLNKLTELSTARKTSAQRDYVPLTEAEKADMTDEQIKKWDEIAKTGLLYNDAGISRLITNLRSAFYDTIEGLGVSPSELGLRTTSYTSDFKVSRGEITLDEDVLRAALENNPHMVMNVFMNISDSADEAAAYRENGLLHRINGVINTYMGGSAQTSLDILETSIYNATKKVDDFEEKMTGLQEKYYLKYAALENAMAQLQSQTNWLAAMLGSTSS